MSRPRVVRIAGHRWTIEWTAAAVRRLKRDPKTEAAGAMSVDQLAIAVERLPKAPTQERHVLVHELLHACFGSVEFSFTTPDQEEMVVRALAGPLLQALRDNPTLVRYLTS